MTLADIRPHIDRIDQEIKKLFQERMELSDQVAQVKAETGDKILKPDREVSMIERLSSDIQPGIKKEYIALLKRIIEVSRKYQYGRTLELRDCLDIDWKEEEPDYTQIAMQKQELYICDVVSRDSVLTTDTYREVGQLVTSGQAQAGIGIMEQVGVGVSEAVHNLLLYNHLYINRCKVIEDQGMRKKVVLFSKDLIVKPDHNRMKLMFVCPNRSGSLASILSQISDYNVTLTEIHSRPNHKEEWNYEFYIEIEANLLSKEIQALMFQLRNEAESFQILGSYHCEGDFK